VPFKSEPLWVKVTEKSPEPPPLGEYDPFHLPSTVDEVFPPPEGSDEVGGGVLVLVDSVPAGGVLVVVLDELEHAARSTPHRMIAALNRNAAERIM
jgi:hypothetical protein